VRLAARSAASTICCALSATSCGSEADVISDAFP
jgi:hypothetical protein